MGIHCDSTSTLTCDDTSSPHRLELDVNSNTNSDINSDVNSTLRVDLIPTSIDNLNIPTTLSNGSPGRDASLLSGVPPPPRGKHKNSIGVKPIEFKVEYHTKSKFSNGGGGKGKYLLYKSRNINTKAVNLKSIPEIFTKLEIILRENPKNFNTQIMIEKYLQKQGTVIMEDIHNKDGFVVNKLHSLIVEKCFDKMGLLTNYIKRFRQD